MYLLFVMHSLFLFYKYANVEQLIIFSVEDNDIQKIFAVLLKFFFEKVTVKSILTANSI